MPNDKFRTIWSTLLYGCETWTLTQQTIKKLQAFDMWVYRKLLNISWKDRKRNEEILNMLKIKMYVLPAIKKRKTVYFEHMIRRDNILVDGQVQGNRDRGRPRTGWATNVYEWTESTLYTEMVRKAQDRRAWKSMAVNLMDEEDT